MGIGSRWLRQDQWSMTAFILQQSYSHAWEGGVMRAVLWCCRIIRNARAVSRLGGTPSRHKQDLISWMGTDGIMWVWRDSCAHTPCIYLHVPLNNARQDCERFERELCRRVVAIHSVRIMSRGDVCAAQRPVRGGPRRRRV